MGQDSKDPADFLNEKTAPAETAEQKAQRKSEEKEARKLAQSQAKADKKSKSEKKGKGKKAKKERKESKRVLKVDQHEVYKDIKAEKLKQSEIAKKYGISTTYVHRIKVKGDEKKW